eukprot:126890_1
MGSSTSSNSPFILKQKCCVWGYCRRLEKRWKKYNIVIPIGIQHIIISYYSVVDVWNDKLISPGLEFIDDTNRTIIKHATSDGWCTAFGTVKTKKSFEWKIKIKHMKDSVYAIFIGLVDAQNEETVTNIDYIGGASVGYAYNSYGYKYHENDAVKYGKRFTTNDVIGVYFDAEQWTLSFAKNHEKYGVAFTLPKSKEYKLGITTYYQNDEIQLL